MLDFCRVTSYARRQLLVFDLTFHFKWLKFAVPACHVPCMPRPWPCSEWCQMCFGLCCPFADKILLGSETFKKGLKEAMDKRTEQTEQLRAEVADLKSMVIYGESMRECCKHWLAWAVLYSKTTTTVSTVLAHCLVFKRHSVTKWLHVLWVASFGGRLMQARTSI